MKKILALFPLLCLITFVDASNRRNPHNPNLVIIKQPQTSRTKRSSFIRWGCSTNDSKGNIILGGAQESKRGTNFAIAMVKPGETLESSITIIPNIGGGTEEECTALAIDKKGRIVVAGSSQSPMGTRVFAAARLNSDGTLDKTFGTNGTVRLAAGIAGGSNDQCNDVALDGDTIVLAGSATDPAGISYFAVAELNSRGGLNRLFGNKGTLAIMPTLAGGVNDRCQTVSIDKKHRATLSGTSADATFNNYFASIRIKL